MLHMPTTPVPSKTSTHTTGWLIVGTPFTVRCGIGEALRQRLAGSGQVVIDPFPGSDTGVPAKNRVEADWRVVVLVESPSIALARHLHAAPGDHDVLAALSRWRDGARALLQLAYQAIPGVVFIDAAEAAATPARLAAWLSRQVADCGPLTLAATEEPPVDPVLATLAAGAALADTAAQRLHEELHATCIALDDTDAALETPAASLVFADTSEAVRRYRLLEAARREAAADAEAAARDREALDIRLQIALEVEAELRRSLAELGPRLERALEEDRRLEDSLRSIQDEFEVLYLKERETDRRLAQVATDSADLGRRLESAEVQARQSQDEYNAQRRQTDELRLGLERAQAEHKQAIDRLAAAARTASEQATAQHASAERAAAQHAAERQSLLQRAERAESGWRTEQHATQARLQELAAQQERLDEAARECTRLATELDRGRHALQALETDRSFLQQQLEAAQASLDAAQITQHETAERAARALEDAEGALALERTSAQAERTALRQQLAQVLAGAERQQERNAALERQRSTELSQLRVTVAQARQEAGLASTRLELMRQQLDEREQDDRDAGRPPTMTVAGLSVADARRQPPHLELSVSVRDVRVLDQAIAALELRLVEHRGQPGLVLTRDDREPAPLRAWAENGREGQRGQMLVVPSDTAGRQTLALLGTQDWLMVRGLVSALERRLPRGGAPDALDWVRVARRLLAALDGLPRRLRYDLLRVESDVDAPGATHSRPGYRVQFVRVLFGARYFDRLSLRWCPGASDGGVELLGPERFDGSPILAAWPVGSGSAWAPIWPLPLGRHRPQSEPHQPWRELPSTDSELLVALLDALPAAANLLADEHKLPSGVTREAVVADIVRWQEQAAEDLHDSSNALLRAARRWRQRRRPDHGEADRI